MNAGRKNNVVIVEMGQHDSWDKKWKDRRVTASPMLLKKCKSSPAAHWVCVYLSTRATLTQLKGGGGIIVGLEHCWSTGKHLHVSGLSKLVGPRWFVTKNRIPAGTAKDFKRTIHVFVTVYITKMQFQRPVHWTMEQNLRNYYFVVAACTRQPQCRRLFYCQFSVNSKADQAIIVGKQYTVNHVDHNKLRGSDHCVHL